MLRRYRPGAPLLPGPLLLGSATGAVRPALTELLDRDRRGRAPAREREGTAGLPIVLGARRTSGSPADLAGCRTCLPRSGLRQLPPVRPGRTVSAGRSAGRTPARTPPARRWTASCARWPRSCAAAPPANLLLRATYRTRVAGVGALRFFLSGRSAYVDGQLLPARPGEAPAPADWDQPLAGKVAARHRGRRGIGAAIAERAGPRRRARSSSPTSPAAGEPLAEVANRVGGTALHLDVAAAGRAGASCSTTCAAHTDGLDIVIHNAGITRDKLLANMKPEQWDSVIAVNLESQLRINAALLASTQLSDAAAGRLPVLDHRAVRQPRADQLRARPRPASSAWSARPRRAFAGHGGTTINAVAPGFIETEMTAQMPFATREVARRLSSLQQAGLPIDVAEAVAWLVLAGRRRGQRPGAAGVRPEPGRRMIPATRGVRYG